MKRVKRVDPVFGTMLYMSDKLRYWESRAPFPPAAKDIEYFVDGSRDTSFVSQHAFFATIQERWVELSVAIQHGLEAAYPELRQIALSSMSIPDCASFEDAEWEVSFSHPISGAIYTVEMCGETPRRVSNDT